MQQLNSFKGMSDRPSSEKIYKESKQAGLCQKWICFQIKLPSQKHLDTDSTLDLLESIRISASLGNTS